MKKRIVSALSLLMLVFSFAAFGEDSSAAIKNEDNRYSMTLSLNGSDAAVELTLLNESSAVLTAGDDLTCTKEREARFACSCRKKQEMTRLLFGNGCPMIIFWIRSSIR